MEVFFYLKEKNKNWEAFLEKSLTYAEVYNYARKLTGANNDEQKFRIFLQIDGENIPDNNIIVGKQDLIKELCLIEIKLEALG